ncbi:MAG: hypothetical protein K2L96_05495 [Muribaculaceae bacterium]|nr:hypothetical protein [Muribaculaceae bacterium]
MKKLNYLASGLMLVFCLMIQSCGGSGSGTTMKDKDGQETKVNYNDPKSYIDAVNQQDFVLAHNILDELYADYLAAYSKSKHFSFSEDQKYWNAANHIYNAEMDYLLPQNDDTATKRAVFTLVQMNPIGDEPIDGHTYSGYNDHMGRYKTYVNFVSEYNKLCLKIIELALFYDNEDAAKTVAKKIKTGYTLEEHDSQYTWTANNIDKERAQELLNNK